MKISVYESETSWLTIAFLPRILIPALLFLAAAAQGEDIIGGNGRPCKPPFARKPLPWAESTSAGLGPGC
jgi:hypothetical protein